MNMIHGSVARWQPNIEQPEILVLQYRLVPWFFSNRDLRLYRYTQRNNQDN
jgi:hypothetical protein